MPHVITQSCCSDGSCVYACPVNCIHPSPDEPGFATAEMLYIDPVACVDCGACVSAPARSGAIAPDTRLDARAAAVHRAQRVVLSEARGQAAADVEAGAGDPGRRGPRQSDGPLTVAIVGSGPGGDVRRRRTADPAAACGSTSSRSCPRLTGWCAPGWRPTTRPPSGSPGCSTGSPRIAGVPVLPQRRGRQAPDPRRPAGTPPRRALRRRRAQRPPARHRRAWACRAPAPPPNSSPGSTAIPTSPICQSISATSGS